MSTSRYACGLALALICIPVAYAEPAQGILPEKSVSADTVENAKALGTSPGSAVDNAVATEVAEASSVDERYDPGVELNARLEQYMDNGPGAALKARMARGELYVGSATSEVGMDPDHPQWGTARVLAFDKAYLKAQADFLRYQGMRISTEKTQKMYEVTGQKIPDFDPRELYGENRVERLLNKLMELGEARLDKALNELDIDPEAFKAEPPEQRHLSFSQRFKREVTRDALGTLTGVVPVKTFESHDSAGKHVVAVVLVWSPKMKALAERIVNAKGDVAPLESRKGSAVLTSLLADKARLIEEFGIRQLYDSQGYPLLVSFGQAGNVYTGNDDRKLRRHRESALKKAELQADSRIAEFVAGKADVQESTTTEEIVEEAVLVNSANQRTSDDVNRIIETLQKNFRATAKANLTGLTTAKSWFMPHPLYEDREIAGVVRLWSPVNEKLARDLKQTSKPTVQKTTSERSTPAGVRESRDVMSADDF